MASRDEFPGGLSPFPDGFLKVELLIDGAWTDVSDDLGDDGVSIVRGREDEQGQPGPASCKFRLKNPTGVYTGRHPSSPYFGLIGRNTQVRVAAVLGATNYRFWGDVAAWVPRWTRKGAEGSYVAVECAGITRRLNQGSSPLRSPLYRSLATLGANLVAYWPVEDGDDATTFAPAVGARPITYTGTPLELAGYSGFRGSEPLPMLGTAHLVARPAGWTGTGFAQVRWLTAVPLTTPNGAVLLRASASGTLGWVDVKYSSGGALTTEAYSDSGTLLGSNTFAYSLDGTKRVRVSLELTQSGGDINWGTGVYEAGSAGAGFGTGTWTGATIGAITQVDVNPGGVDLAGMPFGHLTVEKAVTSLFDVSQMVMNGYLGETAIERMTRLCDENGIPFQFAATGSVALGAQGTDSLMALLREAADADGGVLYELRGDYGLGYRGREYMHTTTKTPTTITYQDNLLRPFEPVDDDQSTRNVVEVQRDGGSSAIVRDDTGPLGTAAVGIYDDQVRLSLASDTQTLQQAGWRLRLGTVDEARWPVIGLDLADAPWLADTAARNAILALSMGDWVKVTDLPAWLPPDDVEVIVQGYTETITPHSWPLEFNAVPASPYRVAVYDNPVSRWDGAGTTLAAAITSTTATTFTVDLPPRVEWTHADGDYQLRLRGEIVTVTDVTAPAGGQQTFTVVRAVNGVAQTHPVDTAVSLAKPSTYALGV